MGLLDWSTLADIARMAGAAAQDFGANYAGRNSTRLADLQAQNDALARFRAPIVLRRVLDQQDRNAATPTDAPGGGGSVDISANQPWINASQGLFDEENRTDPDQAERMRADDGAMAAIGRRNLVQQVLAAQRPERTTTRLPNLVATPQPISRAQLFAGLQPPQLTSLPESGSFGDRVVDNALNVAGKVWTLPNTVLGLTYGGLGTLAGFLAGTKPKVKLGHNAVQFINNPLVNSKSAFTLGNAISYGRNTGPDEPNAYGDPNVKFGPHEEAHTYQAQVLGPLYVPGWLLGGGYAGPQGNIFEAAAQQYGNGQGSWWP